MPLSIDPATKDLVISAGKFVEVSGLENVAHRVRDRLFTFKGEWFLDLEFGPPYLESILGQSAPNLTGIAAILKSEIRKSLEGEANLTAFQIKFTSSTRKLEGSLVLTDAEGEQIQDQFIL